LELELLQVQHFSSDESLLSSTLVRKRFNHTTVVIDGEIDWKFDANIFTTVSE